MDCRKPFSKRLNKLREEKGLTLFSLGEQLSIANEVVHLMEQGVHSPSPEILCAIAEYFHVPMDYLTGQGIYADWEGVWEYREGIFIDIKRTFGSEIYDKIVNLSETELISVLPSIIASISIDKERNIMEITYKRLWIS